MKRTRHGYKSGHRENMPNQGKCGPASKTSSSWVWGIAVFAALVGIGIWLGMRSFRDRQSAVQEPATPTRFSEPLLPIARTNPRSAVSAAPTSASNQSASEDPDSIIVKQVEQANQLLAQGKADEAVAILREAERSNPSDEDVHYNLGIALAKLEKNEEAVKEYQEALRLLPDYAEARNNLGNLLLRMGKSDEALKQFEEAVKVMPDYASAWNNYGNALQQLGRTNLAKEYFQKAVDLDTNYWQAHFNLATSLFREKRFADASAEFNTVLRLQPDFAPAKAALNRISQQSAPAPAQP